MDADKGMAEHISMSIRWWFLNNDKGMVNQLGGFGCKVATLSAIIFGFYCISSSLCGDWIGNNSFDGSANTEGPPSIHNPFPKSNMSLTGTSSCTCAVTYGFQSEMPPTSIAAYVITLAGSSGIQHSRVANIKLFSDLRRNIIHPSDR